MKRFLKHLAIYSIIFLGCLTLWFVKPLFYKGLENSSAKKISPSEEKPFVVLIPSYNNSAYVEKNLRSVFSQHYSNYRVIYIDDHSSDDTFQKVKALVSELHQENRTLLIHNEQNVGALANFYQWTHRCDDHEIVVLVDGDDFLAHDDVLNRLNEAYVDPNVWLTYGNFLDYPFYKQNPVICKKIPSSILDNNAFRKSPWMTSHLRSFYAGLFKKIKLSEFIYRGRFYPMASDLALMLPMLEMSGKHTLFIEDILYLYNRSNPLSDHKVNFAFQQECANAIRSRIPYAPLSELKDESANLGTDIVILSYDRPLQLLALIESLQEKVTGFETIFITYDYSSEAMNTAYEELKLNFPHLKWIETNRKKRSKPILVDLLSDPQFKSPFVFFAKDELIMQQHLDLTNVAKALAETDTFGVFLMLGKNIINAGAQSQFLGATSFIPISDHEKQQSLFAWQFSFGNLHWNTPSPMDGVLYKKSSLLPILSSLQAETFEELEETFKKQWPQQEIGLFYADAKCLKNKFIYPDFRPVPSVALLELFKSGLKINVHSLTSIISDAWVQNSILEDETSLFTKR